MFIGKPFTCGLLHEGCHLLLVLVLFFERGKLVGNTKFLIAEDLEDTFKVAVMPTSLIRIRS